MLAKKPKKSQKLRGTNSHGWGHKKKNRGSGNRGGYGNAGTGARGDAHKPSILNRSNSVLSKIAANRGVTVKSLKKCLMKNPYIGKRGFTSVNKKKNNTISLSHIEKNFDNLVNKGVITKEKDEFVLNASQQGFDKVLGNGNFSKKLTIVCDEISQTAKQRVEEVGGKVILNNQESSKE